MKKLFHWVALIMLFVYSTSLHAESGDQHLRFGVLPLQSPTKLAGMFLPLTEYLGNHLGRPVQFVTSSSFTSFMEKVAQRKYDIIYLNPMLYSHSRPYGYKVIAKVASEPFTGILVVRKAGPIQTLSADSLPNGLRIGFPDPGAFAATVLVRGYLDSIGINVDRQMQVQYFGSQDSAILALYNGLVDIIGTWRPSLRSMPASVRADLQIIAETPPQPQMPIAVRDDLPPEDVRRLYLALTGLAKTEQGQSIIRRMGFKRGFEFAADEEYLEVGQ
ncbi:MAG: phosphate/phosphite/phosphonate ABC transporter substrate-binding protein [Sedimenticola sp.]|nr:phosphate/phosphite/phosphonate ABC transporter substrate-binding protein [Sedimenticola sp.]MCW8950074.1 phosphate/phosphite/phosphonate ABC transporter substrate-binding protein [Sedimenticola sp.]MCW8974399.1 phosphate/phosphite/phosphonate ABC transporter substrate-binding protein [Sedimenticola sp.]MCW9021735.1 phosphate/phosphite/phosphonate ABC transporter substrate-binding protein [Sedimenticola sp.]MDF1528445.1 phosphate/phosphite/phosphonate ABC transporter substrate-binding protei